MFTKREKVLLGVGSIIGVSPFVYGLSEELGWQGLLLAAVILLGIGGSVFGLFSGQRQSGQNDLPL